MAVTDLYVRSKPKASATDLWLHPAGSDVTSPAIERTGTVTTTAVPTGAEAVAEAGGVFTTAQFTDEHIPEEIIPRGPFGAREADAPGGTSVLPVFGGLVVIRSSGIQAPGDTLDATERAPSFGARPDSPHAGARRRDQTAYAEPAAPSLGAAPDSGASGGEALDTLHSGTMRDVDTNANPNEPRTGGVADEPRTGGEDELDT